MATGDVLSVTVGSEGWYADVVVEGFAPGSTYDFGLDANNAPTASTPYLTVVSEGYDNTGVLGTITRTVYLTGVLRQAYPNDASAYESVSGVSDLSVRVSLSEPVYDDDKAGGAGTSGTDATLTAPAGWVSSGGTPSNATVAPLAIVNNSTLHYPAVIANWSRPDRDRLTAASVTLAAVAFHGHPRNQSPVACVVFTAADEHTHTATATSTALTIDSSYGDRNPVLEYAATLDLSGFTDDDAVTCDFVAYPWVGDAACTIDTAALAQSEFTGQIPRQTYILDIDGSLGWPIVVVDPVNGLDSRTRTDSVFASDTSANRTSAAAAPVATISRAVRLLYEHNNAVNARASAAGGTVYFASGTSSVAGAVVSTPWSVAKWSWLTLTPLPGVTDAVLTPDANSGNRYVYAPGVKFSGCTLSRSADAYFVRGPSTTASRVIFDGCTITDTRSPNSYGTFQYGFAAVEIIRSTIGRVLAGASRVRGNYYTAGYPLAQLTKVILGCTLSQDSSSWGSIIAGPSSQATDGEGAIMAFNKFTSLHNDALTLFNQAAVTYTRGVAIVQNLFEFLDTSSEPGWRTHADGTTGLQTRDCVAWHNTVAGQRWNAFYNEEGATAYPHLGHSVSLNAFEYLATKGDTFNGASGPNGARTGNWMFDNGVLTFGNRIVRGSFNQRFRGLWSRGGIDGVGLDLNLGYTDDRSGPSGTGGGDYRPAAGSVLIATGVPAMLPYDLDGNPRSATSDTAGAYAAPAGSLNRLKIGSTQVAGLYIGSSAVTAAYIGTTQVWP